MWTFYNPVRIICGEGEFKNIRKHMDACGFERSLVVCDPFHYKVSGLAQQIVDACGDKITGVYYDIEPNPTLENVEACKAMLLETGATSVISLGGGSSMDCAKAAAASAKMGCTASELVYGKVICKECYPIIAIPTTSGTGSEVTSGAVISDHSNDAKIGVAADPMYAKMAIVDPELTYTVPKYVTACSGIDVLAHALDLLCSKNASPITVPQAIQAARLVFENLERVVADGSDREARARLSEASCIIGASVSQTGTTASHACSYFLTAKYNLPHGEACGYTLDGWVEFSAKAKPEIHDYARQIGFADANAMAQRIRELRSNIGLKSSLAELGVTTEEQFEELCLKAMSPKLATNVGDITADDVRAVFAAKR